MLEEYTEVLSLPFVMHNRSSKSGSYKQTVNDLQHSGKYEQYVFK
jgi:hypothetical protein